MRRVTIGFLLVAGLSWLIADDASAAMLGSSWRHRQNYRAPAAAVAPSGQAVTARSNSAVANSYPGRGGWNANNTWYNAAPYGNYAPPPYATSRSAFIQLGAVPAFGGVRSLPGWGGAR